MRSLTLVSVPLRGFDLLIGNPIISTDLENLSAILFQSPCGDLLIGNQAYYRSDFGILKFQSPCGDLLIGNPQKKYDYQHSSNVSVPLRGFVDRKHESDLDWPAPGDVSVPLRGFVDRKPMRSPSLLGI